MRTFLLPPFSLTGLLLLLLSLVPAPTLAAPRSFEVEGEKMRVDWINSRLSVQLKPKDGEGGYALSERVFRSGRKSIQTLYQYHGRSPLLKGRYLTLPLEALEGPIRGAALGAFFHQDHSTPDGWQHKVTHSWENLSVLAGYFTKSDVTPFQIARYNRLRNNGNLLRRNDTILIPWKWIDPELKLAPGSHSPQVSGPLYVKKDDPKHVYYRLQAGEAIYTSVVARFTGRLLNDEVNELAQQLMSLNQIKNPRLLQPKQELRIPLDWISEEYLDGGGTQEAVARKAPSKRSLLHRERLHVILDAGHGGRDPGAIAGSRSRGDYIYEDEAVYDISRRLVTLLEQRGVTVHNTLMDPNQQGPVSRLNTRHDQDEYLLVTPRYTVRNARTGVNMRVYLINHLYQQLRKQKVPEENIVFLSLHGDALHPSLSGAMVYYPDHRLRRSRFNLNSSVYRKRSEYTRAISFPSRENRESAEISKAFGKTVIQAFQTAGLRVHSSKAVRGYLYRRGHKTLPGVLRYSKVPTSVLVEVSNLNNSHDRKALLQASVRQKMAAALANALELHFTEGAGMVAQR